MGLFRMRRDKNQKKEKAFIKTDNFRITDLRNDNLSAPFLLAGQKFLYENRTDFYDASRMDSGSVYIGKL